MSGSKLTAIVLLASTVFGITTAILQGDSYKIAGTIECKGGLTTADLPFEITVDDCKWLIRITNFVTDYVEVSCDGVSTYYLNSMAATVKAKNERGEPVGDNVATGIVSASPVPRFPFSGAESAGATWLAYASGCYFRLLTNDVVEPPVSFGVTSSYGRYPMPGDHVSKRALIGQRGNGLGTPARVDYLEGAENPFTKQPYPPPFDLGFTNTAFQIVSVTNVFGTEFPSLSRLVTYALFPGSLTDGPRLEMRQQYEVTTASIQKATPLKQYQPDIPGVTSISDVRFTDEKGLKLNYDTNKWLTLAQARQTLAFKRAASQLGMPVARPGKALVIGIFVLFLLLPAGALVYKTLTRQRKH
jgi:hypothetical protein